MPQLRPTPVDADALHVKREVAKGQVVVDVALCGGALPGRFLSLRLVSVLPALVAVGLVVGLRVLVHATRRVGVAEGGLGRNLLDVLACAFPQVVIGLSHRVLLQSASESSGGRDWAARTMQEWPASKENDMTEWAHLPDLAGRSLGGAVVAAKDE
jgi:hypothetical protein